MLECEYYDLSHVSFSSNLLVRTVSSNCLMRTGIDPFHLPISFFPAVKKETLDYLEKLDDSVLTQSADKWKDKSNCEIIAQILEDFTQSKMNIFYKMSNLFISDEKKTEKVNQLIAEIESQKKWPQHEREVTSKKLFKLIDKACDSHCRVQFPDEDSLNKHQETCKFRPIACENEECHVVVSACHLEEHDLTCPYKLLECDQRCSALIRRSEMENHCRTVCPRRVISCPYVNAGCNASFFQEELANHSKSSLEIHLYLVFKAFENVKTQVIDHSARFNIVEKSIPLLEKTSEVNIKKLDLYLSEFEKNMRKELSSIRHDIKVINSSRR